jgi:hypothetical protein
MKILYKKLLLKYWRIKSQIDKDLGFNIYESCRPKRNEPEMKLSF